MRASQHHQKRDAGVIASNPTSNRRYQRLGYVPVTDRVLLAPEPRSR
jgi:hypothetical protein